MNADLLLLSKNNFPKILVGFQNLKQSLDNFKLSVTVPCLYGSVRLIKYNKNEL